MTTKFFYRRHKDNIDLDFLEKRFSELKDGKYIITIETDNISEDLPPPKP